MVKTSKKEKHRVIRCSCCRQEVYQCSFSALLKQIDELVSQKMVWWAADKDTLFSKLSKFQWACDYCLQSNRATLAQPKKQKFYDYPPYLAYYKKLKTCHTCDEIFVFSASEQQFWYEDLKFWVQSWAKDCLPCRKKARERKGIST